MAQGLERLEQQLERWVEGTLAGWLGAEIPAAILAGQLARAMEDGVQTDMRGGLRAPDHYALALHPDHVQALLERGAEWTGEMGRELLAAAQAHGFGMARDPQVSLAADPGLPAGRSESWHGIPTLRSTSPRPWSGRPPRRRSAFPPGRSSL